MNLSVSIIIPAYNAEKTIAHALKSCVNQKLQIHEVIVVNNNSTDDTISMARKIDNILPLILLKEKRKGASSARNVGLNCLTESKAQI
jgi:teichuronic acid biosynthesis glycosyltransferase TuaG